MALTTIQKVRLEVADIDQAFPILADADYEYFLEKNNNSVARTSLDAAKTILLVLSQRTDDTVDIFSIKGKSAAEQYRLALQLFLRDPSLNPVLQNCQGWFGGISLSEMKTNDETSDNNVIVSPSQTRPTFPINFFTL